MAKRIIVYIIFSLAISQTQQVVFAGDADIGEAIAGPCVACHGVAGASPIADYPIIAGQHEKYLIYVLNAYKDGKRKNAVMEQQVAELTKRDLENLAAYFARQESSLGF